jgi:hypothetical protein
VRAAPPGIKTQTHTDDTRTREVEVREACHVVLQGGVFVCAVGSLFLNSCNSADGKACRCLCACSCAGLVLVAHCALLCVILYVAAACAPRLLLRPPAAPRQVLDTVGGNKAALKAIDVATCLYLPHFAVMSPAVATSLIRVPTSLIPRPPAFPHSCPNLPHSAVRQRQTETDRETDRECVCVCDRERRREERREGICGCVRVVCGGG